MAQAFPIAPRCCAQGTPMGFTVLAWQTFQIHVERLGQHRICGHTDPFEPCRVRHGGSNAHNKDVT